MKTPSMPAAGRGRTAPAYVEQIDLEDSAQVERWCARLRCSPLQLRNVVLAQGRAANDVQGYVERRRAAVAQQRQMSWRP
ncbi:MAG: hypothetical protein JWQ72_27 [Polaromonas sp.]|nr:hypothetical protein [Polaromonas sp.]